MNYLEINIPIHNFKNFLETLLDIIPVSLFISVCTTIWTEMNQRTPNRNYNFTPYTFLVDLTNL